MELSIALLEILLMDTVTKEPTEYHGACMHELAYVDCTSPHSTMVDNRVFIARCTIYILTIVHSAVLRLHVIGVCLCVCLSV